MELKINCTWNNHDDAGQTTDDPLQDDHKLTAVSAYIPLSLFKKVLAHWLSVGEVAFGQVGVTLPRTPVVSIQNKAHFPFHQPSFFFGSWGG